MSAAGVTVHVSEFWRGMIQSAAWGLAVMWCVRTAHVIWYMPEMPNLTLPDWDVGQGEATLVVVIPALDEAECIAATCDALLMADYARMRILAVDDRSTDETGTILDEYAERHPGKLDVIHISELPEGWLGKTYAMTVAVENSVSDYVLFTDADVLMSPSILRRAMAYAEASEADHLVVMPTPLVKTRGEGIVLGFCQLVGIWVQRPWRISDPEARDTVGVGAFNLVRRDALTKIGGLGPQRLAVLEDVTLGWRIKAAGLRQRIAFAPGLVLVHWARGAGGVVRAMTKNLFSGFNFNPLVLMGACFAILVFFFAPLAGVAWWRTLAPALIVLCSIGAAYRALGNLSLIDARYGWLYPLGGLALLYAMLRSMVIVWVRGGVEWRGTLYALRDLRRHNNPLQWRRAAADKRAAPTTR